MESNDRRHSFDRRQGDRRHSADRRNFLRAGAAAAAVVAVPRVLRAASAAPNAPVSAAAPASAARTAPAAATRALAFVHTHTREQLEIAYCLNGQYQPAALAKLNYLLRDFRTNQMKPIDPKLFDLLHELSTELGTESPFHVISGYRSPLTNQMLRERGGAHTGVATNSLHMVGQAMDIRIPSVKLKTVREAAASLKRGGVGYYPSSDFVHVDTGRVRYW